MKQGTRYYYGTQPLLARVFINITFSCWFYSTSMIREKERIQLVVIEIEYVQSRKTNY